MISFSRLACIPLLAALLAGALPPSPVAFAQAVPDATRLTGTYPLPDGLFTNQIVFYFDGPLAPVEDPAALIAFEPPLTGTWSQGERYVALTLLGPQAPANGIYRARFLPALAGASGQSVPMPAEPLLFSNFELELVTIEYGQINTTSTQIVIAFSASVSWEQLQQHLQISDSGGNTVQFTAPRRAATRQHVLTVPTLASAPYQIRLSPGLSDASGTFQTSAAIERTTPVPPPFSVDEIAWRHASEGEDRITLHIPYALDPRDFLAHFQVFPDGADAPVILEPEDTEASQQLSFSFDRPAEDYGTIRYQFSGTMEEIPALYSQQPLSGTLLPTRNPLRIEYHNWEAEGAEPLRLSLFFNGSVDPDALAKFVEVSPAIENFSIQTGTYGSTDLYGDWKTGQAYKLLIKPGLTDRAGGLENDKDLAWNPGRAPKRSGIGFAFETPYYFPRRTAGPLPLYGRNVEEAKATLYELFPSNLVKALEQMDNGKSPGEFGWGLARQVAEHTVKFEGDPDSRLEASIPLEGFMPEGRKGIFGIALSPAYDYYNTKVIVWTDIGVLAHWQEDALLLYAHNLWDLAPVAGAKVTVYSSKHQVMGTVETDAEGVARLEHWDTELGTPRVAIVETEDDFTFLRLQPRSDDPVAFTDGMPAYDPEGYDAFLYADRNLYRPGETMHLRWLVRQGDGSPLTGAPLLLRVRDPQDGRHDFTESLSDWGSGTVDVETKNNWLTGTYSVELWVPGAPTALTSQTVNIEDFVPNRLAATVTPGAPYWLPGEEHGITVHGEHLSGGAARNRKTGAVVILEKKPWKPEGWTEYTFTNDTPFNSDVRDLGEETTDDSGDAAYRFSWQPPKGLSFPVAATLRGEVFEAGGRSVAGRAQTTLFPADTLVGLAVANGATNSVDVAVAAVHANGRPAPLETVEVTLEKKRWSYYVRRYASHNETNWHDNFETLSTHTVTLAAGKGTANIPVPSGYGTYRVKVSRADSPQYATQSFWAYRGQAHLADASRPSLIELTPDKKTYTIGETATVQITSPFDGNAIVVVQQSNLEELITVPITGGVGTLSLPLSAAHYPNVWLQTTVIHPVEPGTALTYPYASFAMVNIPVHDPARALSVRFEGLPEVMRPLTALPVTLHVAGPEGTPVASEVTLALVDEGIHQILQYRNPDPVSWFQRPRRPDFRRAHYYDQVAYDFTGKPIGGGALLMKRLGEDDATVDDNWIKPLALWSGVVETDATGVATITMDIPEFAGKVRLVAVATTGSEAGSAAANVTIRRPVVLQTTLPRFVSPGDTFEATALLQNKQDSPVSVTLAVATTAPIGGDPFTGQWDIPAGGEVVVTVPLAALDAPGSGRILWSLETLDGQGAALDRVEIETNLIVQAPSIYQTRGALTVLFAGEQREFVNTEFRDNEVLESTLRVTPNALARLSEALKYVVGYPHGCVEQTVSRCMPLYLLGQAARQTGSDWDAAYFQQFVQAGIDRLVAMQTRSGGLGNWPGAQEPYAYGSIYAAHFLSLAKQDPAFNVPEEPYARLMEYLRGRIHLAPNEGQASLYNYAYACYVRALAKDAQVMEDITSLDTLEISTAARQWLALAMLTFTRAPDQVQAYLLNRPSAPYGVREQGGTLNSPIRNDALTLIMQMKLGVDSGLIQSQAEKLIRYLETHRYSTQEAAFVITALADYLKEYVGDMAQASASIATPDGVEAHTGDFQFKATHKGPGARFTVANEGPTPLYVHHIQAGILVNPDVAAAANGIALTRHFENEAGPVDSASLKHGKNYLVSVEITCDENFENVVLVDLLPGGLDIENPRLDGDSLAPWKKSDGVRPDYIDIRDDRLVAAFDRLKRGTHRYYYVVRTVTPGTFRHPGANAECMYAVEFNGRTAGGEVTIGK